VAPNKKPLSLGKHLRAQRLAAELSQSELSDRCGISKPTISRYENDHVQPSIDTLKRLAAALGLEVSSLLPATDLTEQHLSDAMHRRGMEVNSAAEANHLLDMIDDIRAEVSEGHGERT
jgi:putative transcriptional regulator